MPKSKVRFAVFPGTFDPITNGHVDIIARAQSLFDRLIVAVGVNPDKQQIFTQDERVRMIRKHVSRHANVTVEAYRGLTVDFARSMGASTVVRGIRATADLHYELQQAHTNRIVGNIETVFLMTDDRHALVSSSLIKQIVQMGGNNLERLERLVPRAVAEALRKKLGKPKRRSRPKSGD